MEETYYDYNVYVLQHGHTNGFFTTVTSYEPTNVLEIAAHKLGFNPSDVTCEILSHSLRTHL